jgi:DNA-binding CsgD family transcriptional regulator
MRTFHPGSEHYDGRKKMAQTLARSSGASIAAIGLLSLSNRRIADMWISTEKADTRISEIAALETVSQAIMTLLSLAQVDPALRKRDLHNPSQGEAPLIWSKSNRHLIGIGDRVGNLATFTALVYDTPNPVDTSERRNLVRVGLTYANQLLHERTGKVINKPPLLPDIILQSLSFGVAVVTATGSIDYLKDSSGEWLAKNGVLDILNGRLAAKTPYNQNLLHNALVAATDGAQKTSVLQLEAEEDAPLNTLIILPLQDAPSRALIIFGQEQEDSALRDLVLQTFGLTLAERRLTQHLLAGKSLAAAAKEANLTISTARSYLKRIFAKTGIHRQSQLMTLFYKMMPSVKAAVPPPPQDHGPHS